MTEDGIPEMCRMIYATEDVLNEIFEKSTGKKSKTNELDEAEAEKTKNKEINKVVVLDRINISDSAERKKEIKISAKLLHLQKERMIRLKMKKRK